MTEAIKLPVTAEEIMGFSHEQRVELAELVAGLLADAKIEDLESVKLFGSVAKKSDGKGSDIDLLITHEGEPDGCEFMGVAMAAYETLAGKGIPVSNQWDKKVSDAFG